MNTSRVRQVEWLRRTGAHHLYGAGAPMEQTVDSLIRSATAPHCFKITLDWPRQKTCLDVSSTPNFRSLGVGNAYFCSLVIAARDFALHRRKVVSENYQLICQIKNPINGSNLPKPGKGWRTSYSCSSQGDYARQAAQAAAQPSRETWSEVVRRWS